MNAHNWLTEQEHRLSMLLSQVFIYVKAPMHINSHTKFQLGFSKFQFSTVRTANRVKLHHYAKLCRNRSNRSLDIARYRRHVRFLKFQIFNGRKGRKGRKRSKCICMPNFVEIVWTAAEICEFQYYASLAWKCLFTPLFVFLDIFPPNDDTHRPNLQKDDPWAEPRHLIAMIGLSCTVTEMYSALLCQKSQNLPTPA